MGSDQRSTGDGHGDSESEGRRHAPMESRVLGGSEARAEPETAWDSEPLSTIRTERRLFQLWLPLAFLGGLLIGVLLLQFGLQVALISMLVVQTGGFFATYLVAQRRSTDPLRGKASARDTRE